MKYEISHNFEGNTEGTRIYFLINIAHSPAEIDFIRQWFIDFQEQFPSANITEDMFLIRLSLQVVKVTDLAFLDIYKKLILDIESHVQKLEQEILLKKDWIESQDKILELSVQLNELTTLLKILLGKCGKLKPYRDKFFKKEL
jgi:hypothetical protein